jgi:hypothetical protein
MMAKALVEAYQLPDTISSIRSERLIPTFRNKNHRFKYNERDEIPRVQHSHAQYSSLFFHRKRVILLVRDLRDTIISHFRTYRSMKDPQISFHDFLRGRGVHRPKQKKGNTLLTLIDFLNSWSRNSSKLEALLLVRYEDMLANTHQGMSQILRFSSFANVDEELVARVVEFGSIQNMRKIEAENPLPQYAGKTHKVRQPREEGYKAYFSAEDKEYFCLMVDGKLYDHHGYDYKRW